MKSTNEIEREILRLLRGRMGELGVRNVDLAAALGVSQQKVGRTVAGRQTMKIPFFLTLCEELGVSAGILLARAERRVRPAIKDAIRQEMAEEVADALEVTRG